MNLAALAWRYLWARPLVALLNGDPWQGIWAVVIFTGTVRAYTRAPGGEHQRLRLGFHAGCRPARRHRLRVGAEGEGQGEGQGEGEDERTTTHDVHSAATARGRDAVAWT